LKCRFMNTHVADATQTSKNLSLETRRSPAPSVTPKTSRKNFLSSAPRGLKNLLPVLPLRGQAAPPAIGPPAVRAGKEHFYQFKFEGIGTEPFLLGPRKRIGSLYLSKF
jgi:hypothetical protein